MESLLKLFSLTPQDVQMIPVGALFFVVLWWLLARVVFKPYLALIEAREAATTGAVDTSREILARAAEIRASCGQRLGAERLDAVKRKLVAIGEAKKNATAVTEEAERQAQATLKQGRVEIARDIEAVRSESMRDADALADMIVEKVTSGSGPASQTGAH